MDVRITVREQNRGNRAEAVEGPERRGESRGGRWWISRGGVSGFLRALGLRSAFNISDCGGGGGFPAVRPRGRIRRDGGSEARVVEPVAQAAPAASLFCSRAAQRPDTSPARRQTATKARRGRGKKTQSARSQHKLDTPRRGDARSLTWARPQRHQVLDRARERLRHIERVHQRAVVGPQRQRPVPRSRPFEGRTVDVQPIGR